MNKTQLKRWLGRFVTACIFGAAFWLLTELGESRLSVLTGGQSDCCQRCSEFLYHAAQPVLAFCAAAAFFSQSPFEGTASRFKRIVKTFFLTWVCFQMYSAWTAWHLYRRTPCTALYSPGHAFVFGVVFVGIFLLIESSIWTLLCGVLILLIKALKSVLRKEDPLSLSLKAFHF